MKKITVLMFVFFGVNLLLSAKSFDVTDLNALPGMPVLHDNEDNKAATARKALSDADMANMFAHNDYESYQSYLQNIQDNGGHFKLLPGNMSSSHWLQKKIVSYGYRTAENDTFSLIQNQNNCRGTIKISPQYSSCGHIQKMMVAHQPPSFIFHLDKKCKVRSFMIGFQVLNNNKGCDLIRNLDAKITANYTKFDTLFNANALKRNSKPVCVIVIEGILSDPEERENENNTVTNQGLEFILPQRI